MEKRISKHSIRRRRRVRCLWRQRNNQKAHRTKIAQMRVRYFKNYCTVYRENYRFSSNSGPPWKPS